MTNTRDTEPDRLPDPSDIAAAANILCGGGLVAFPTETVYGLGADARDGTAVAGIYALKNRPAFNPLIVHVPDREAAAELVRFPAQADALADAFWPGPFTLVLPARSDNGISSLVTAGLDTLAVRVPSHPSARALLTVAACPVAGPSANRSGRISPTRADHVRAEFGADAPLVLDGGASADGLESTIVDLSGDVPALLRPGTVARDAIEAVLGEPLSDLGEMMAGAPTAPGQLASHYAPAASIRLDVAIAQDDEGFLGFGPEMPTHNGPSFNLSVAGDLREAAANLFDALRTLDASGVPMIAVMPIPAQGVGEAINDRLRRAAAPRT